MKKFLLSFLLLFFLYSPAWAAVAVVQTASASSTGDVSSITTPNINTTTGNLIVCNASRYLVSGTNYTVSDNKGNGLGSTGISLVSSNDTNAQLKQRYQENAAGGSGHNFTLTAVSGSDYLSLACMEISGALTAGALDQVAGKDNNSGTTGLTSSTTSTTSQANEILCGAASAFASTTFTAQGGFTETSNYSTDPNHEGLLSACKVVSATGAYEFLFDIGTGQNGVMGLIGTFKATGAAGGAVVQRRRPIQW